MPVAPLRSLVFRPLRWRSGGSALLLSSALLLPPPLAWSQTASDAAARASGRPVLVLPDGGRAHRMVKAQQALGAEELARLSTSTQERRDWQRDCNLRHMLAATLDQ